MIVPCAHCGSPVEKTMSDINRARKRGCNLYCTHEHAVLARKESRKDTRTIAENKLAKRLYDMEYRKRTYESRKVQKAEHHKKTYDPVKQHAYNQRRMPHHVEYCRRPEYKEYKRIYDREYRARCKYGEFAEAFLTLMDIEKEVESRMDRYEIGLVNGTINKAQNRRREYERLNSN